MLVVTGNKKIKILFYIFIFIFLSTVSFFERTNIFSNKIFFPLNKIEIYGYEKVDYVAMQSQLSNLIGQNLLFMNSKDIEEILDENKLISEFTIQKKYPDTVNINLKEVNFVAKVFKGKKKYFLADNDNLISFKDYVIDQDLPNIYGKHAEYYFNDFQKLLKLNNFNINMWSKTDGNDIKKVLAYSTVSQLGFMIMSVGTGAYVAAFFHLVTHAAFKANLFYGSGSVIHAMHHALHKKNDHETDPQDMRNMGGFKSRMPTTYRAMLVSTLAIAGVPFFSGFLSKDAILAGSLSFANHHPEHFLLPIFGFSAALLTAFYMFRLMYMTFHNEPQMPELIEEIHESPKEMTFPLVLLGGLSFFIFFTLPHFNPFSDQGWFTEIIRPRTSLVAGAPSAHAISEGIHQSHLPAMIISVLVGGFGIFLAWLMYLKQSISAAAMAGRFNTLYRLSLNKFYIDEIYSRFIYTPILKLADWVGYLDWDVYDKYVVDGFGRITEWFSNLTGKLDYDGLDQGIVDGAGRSAHWLGGVLRGLQTGQLQSYVLFALFGVILIVIFQTMV